MKRARLIREYTGDQGTFGRIYFDDYVRFTGELPERDNAPNISCIPAGSYRCAFTFSPRFKRGMYLIEAVPGRSGVRIHPANLMGDSKLGLRCQLNGCIALAERKGTISGQSAILVSAPAVSFLEQVMRREPFELEIVQ